MRPVIEKRGFEFRHFVYIIIIIFCMISIGIVLYLEFYEDEKLGVIIGITNEKEDQEYKSLKENFFNIFDNSLVIIEECPVNINKIRSNQDIILLGENTQEQTENYILDIKIPYFNINSDICKMLNQEIKETYKYKSQSVISSKKDINVLYNVKYKAYIKKEILSLVILSELKEGNSSERIIIQTYNYDLKENRRIYIKDILDRGNIDKNEVNNKIRAEIRSSQEQNLKLSELGYNISIRDANSDSYKIDNVEEFFYGENGYLYIVYPYGNREFTSEMDVVIFREL